MPLGERADIILGRVQQRTDERDACSVKVGHRLEAGDTPLVKQREHVSLDHVVKVVAERDLFAARGLGSLVQRAAAHFGAQRTGIFLLADIKDDRPNLGRNADVLDAKRVAQRPNGGEVHLRIAHFERDGDDLKLLRIERAQPRQRNQQRKRVLAAGYADRDAVAFLDHMIVVHRTADVGEQFLHEYASLFRVLERDIT